MRSAETFRGSELKVFLARDLIGRPDHLFYLCHNPTRNERRPAQYVWRSRGERVVFSVADAIAAAPRLKFAAKHVGVLPPPINGIRPIGWGQVHNELFGVGIRVVGVMGGGDIGYDEFLAALRGEYLPNSWFLHSQSIH